MEKPSGVVANREHKDMKLLRNYIRRILVEQRITVQPPPAAEEEIHAVINQYFNRYNSEELQYDLDENMDSLFDNILKGAGYCSDIEYIKSLREHTIPIIKGFKEHCQRPRPGEVAQKLGLNWQGDISQMSTAKSYSYPSGHTVQAYYVAYKLADKYPNLLLPFFQLAEMVSQSRIDRGVHFPSDVSSGRELAHQIYVGKK